MKWLGRVAAGAAATWLALGCAGDAGEGTAVVNAPPQPPLAASNPKPPETLRLPADVARPKRMAVTLTVVPAEDVIHGEIDLDLEFLRPTDVLWLDATELTIEEAHLEQGGASTPARVVPGGEDFAGFVFQMPAAAGPARLHAKYSGKVLAGDDRGVFRVVEDGAPYLFSQFENTEARRAFPCFDEPAYKHPWQVTLRVKKGDRAFSNTSPEREEAGADGFTTFRFAETKALPAYLVAFAVGPFEIVDAGKTRAGTPVRVATPRGKQLEGAYAAKSTAAIIDLLEEYFGVPYPYSKMDVVPIPRLASFGAMENAGMITIAMSYSLARKDEQTPTFERNYVDIMAHELAHQWFGDLVTMAWWDDVWLNEAFATWMGAKTIVKGHPEWRMDIARLRGASHAMGDDALASARKIRQEIATKDDIQNAFDNITYEKGATVIGMFEQLVGAKEFQRGIQLYVKRHAFGNATGKDFLADVSEGAHRDVTAAFSTFLDQPGVPLVHATVACDKGAPRIELSQERYVPIGSHAAVEAWQVPVCAKYGSGATTATTCTLLTGKTGTLALPKCPSFALPKADAQGYYRVAYDKKTLDSLLRAHKNDLSIAERVSVVGDAGALVPAGVLPIGDALSFVADLANDPDPSVVLAGAELLGAARPSDEQRPAFARFVHGAVGPASKKLGWLPKPGDSSDTRRLRTHLLPTAVVMGEDAALADEAKALAAKWLGDPAALDADSIDGVLQTAATYGDHTLFERMRAEAKKTADDNRRDHILHAMPHFRDPAILREVYALSLSQDFDIRQSFSVLAYSDRFSEDVQIAFVKEHFAALAARVPAELRPEIFSVLAGLCSEDKRVAAEAAFKDMAAKVTGGPRRYEQILEGVSTCIAQKKAMLPSLAAFLKAR